MNAWKLSEEFEFEGRVVRYGSMGEGRPIVVVHGTPWSSFNLRHLVFGLAKDYKVYFFDLMGYGQSSKGPGDVSLAIQNRILAALIEFWNLDHPIVIGHDFGGATVLRAHLINQVSFEKMVLIDPVAISPWGSPFFMHVREHEKAFSGVPDYIHEAIVSAYVQTAAYRPIEDLVLDQIIQYWMQDEGKGAFYRQIAQADSRYTDEVEALYPSISTPTLILWGRNDAWIPVEKGQKLHEMIPHSRLRIIDDAGHLVIEEKPEELLKGIHDFLFD